MKRIILSLIFVLVLFCVFTVARTPAQFALQYLPPSVPVELEGVSGTIWKGQAISAIVDGTELGKTTWKVNPLPLFLAKGSVDFTINKPGLVVSGNAVTNKDQEITLTDVSVNANVETLPLPAAAGFVEPSGKLIADFSHVEIINKKLQAAEGDVIWNPAKINSPSPFELGELLLKVTGDSGKIKGVLSGKNTPLTTKGDLTLTPNGMLNVNIKATPHGSTPPEIRDLLPMAGRQAADGSVTIKQQFRIY